jgi:hypothetical protein
LASAPAQLEGLGHDSFALRFSTAGKSLVRLHYTPYWTVVRGHGCLASRGGWTTVSVKSAGVVHVAARFSLGRALGLAGGCD